MKVGQIPWKASALLWTSKYEVGYWRMKLLFFIIIPYGVHVYEFD